MQLYAPRKRTWPLPLKRGPCGTQAQELEARRDTVDELPFFANTCDPMNAIKKANCVRTKLHQIPCFLNPLLGTLYFL